MTDVCLTGVSKSFVTPAEVVAAVSDVSFKAHDGDFVCIHGASGCGKSTLLSILSGLDVPDAGSVSIAGRRVDNLSVSDRARVRLESIGVVFQHDNLIEEFTAYENIAFPLQLLKVRDDSTRADVALLLSQMGLSGLGDRKPYELSGGQQQRVGIARALAGGRRLIVADEPTAALDSVNSRAIFELFAKLAHDGVTIVLASHDPLALEYSTRTVEMVDGQLRD